MSAVWMRLLQSLVNAVSAEMSCLCVDLSLCICFDDEECNKLAMFSLIAGILTDWELCIREF